MPAPLLPSPGPSWLQLNNHLLWLLLASSPPLFPSFLLPQLPKLLALSSLNWFSAKSLFVPLLRPLWVVPGASAPPPPVHPRAPPQPLRPAPLLRRPGPVAGLPASLLLRRPTPRLAPWLSSPRLPSDFARLCFLFPPPVSYCACGEGGRGAGASWRDGAGFLLPGPFLSLLVHPFVSFSGLSCRSSPPPRPQEASLSLLLCKLLSCFCLILSLLFSLLLFFFLSIFPFLPVSHFPSFSGYL